MSWEYASSLFPTSCQVHFNCFFYFFFFLDCFSCPLKMECHWCRFVNSKTCFLKGCCRRLNLEAHWKETIWWSGLLLWFSNGWSILFQYFLAPFSNYFLNLFAQVQHHWFDNLMGLLSERQRDFKWLLYLVCNQIPILHDCLSFLWQNS